ncbi:chymotrypsinogen A-like [Dreissena polymorpha]|uniref:Peptidase S1 domain-containing protein n=1 Tax=Dreissena polymorpha TaxID=45954 RepID=A0A9D3YVQ4_DREPO|nr:chymotrypsinogen A-like [Dreissena polymorpha]KAH3706226.1 hypothetical protein DPMN_065611 [Dreissena polymorpha]
MVGYLLAFVFLLASANGDTISRIINGSPTTIASHPHQISLQRYTTSSGGYWYHTCGGSIVRSKWVVTAAHCVEGSSASTLQVVLTNGFLSDPNRKSYAVRRVVMHPNYNVGSGAYPHDIALLELTSDADLSGTNKAIELATTGENFDRQTCEISGWGHTVTGTQPNKQIPDQLQETNGVIMTNSECTSSWGTNYAGSVHICINNRNTGTCQGDSGGPMVCFRGTTPVLAGVTSWGVSGCGTTYPSVYARVSTYRSWLDTTMGI